MRYDSNTLLMNLGAMLNVPHNVHPWQVYQNCTWPRVSFPTRATHLTGSRKAAGEPDGMLMKHTVKLRGLNDQQIESCIHGYNLCYEIKTFWAVPTSVYQGICSPVVIDHNGEFQHDLSRKPVKLAKQVIALATPP